MFSGRRENVSISAFNTQRVRAYGLFSLLRPLIVVYRKQLLDEGYSFISIPDLNTVRTPEFIYFLKPSTPVRSVAVFRGIASIYAILSPARVRRILRNNSNLCVPTIGIRGFDSDILRYLRTTEQALLLGVALNVLVRLESNDDSAAAELLTDCFIDEGSVFFKSVLSIISDEYKRSKLLDIVERFSGDSVIVEVKRFPDERLLDVHLCRKAGILAEGA